MIIRFKIFEKLGKKSQGVFYFIPYVDKSLAIISIKKLNISNKSKKLILECEELFESLESDRVIRGNIGFFIGISNNLTYPISFWACSGENDKDKAYRTFMESNIDYFYGGEILLEDWEISTNMYNI